MELINTHIRNFRSIESVDISFDPRFRVLVGINESGKSNTLKALSLLTDDISPEPGDKREISPDEKPLGYAYILFDFQLSQDETEEVYEDLSEYVLSKNDDSPVLEKDGKIFTLREFCQIQNTFYYRVNVLNQTKATLIYKLPSGYKAKSNWKKPSGDCPPDYYIKSEKGEAVLFKELSLINVDDYPSIPKSHLENIDPEYVRALVTTRINEMGKNNLPECVFWKYGEEDFLPPTINIQEFSSNPDICEPLKNIFELCGTTNIKVEFEKASGISQHGLQNLLNRVALTATKYLHNVWKEYKSVSFELALNGDNIDIGVKDRFNRYEFSQRSDGFKRFVTFLLMISTKVQADLLENTLILIDEPETSLHISGTRYFRDELIKLSKRNYVVVSTHSIFMIDGKNIGRHLIVAKKDEKTSVEHATESNITDEEVLYNALGSSIFESLKQKNIIFEGWRDKRLFEVAMRRVPKEFKDIKKKYRDVGLCHAQGAKDIRRITPMLQLANRECFILTDDDQAAKEQQNSFIESKGYGTWKRYSQVLADCEAITGEDFVKTEVFLQSVNDSIRRYSSAQDFPTVEDIVRPKGRVYALGKWLDSHNIDSQVKKAIIDDVKEEVFSNLKSTQVERSYYEMLQRMADLI